MGGGKAPSLPTPQPPPPPPTVEDATVRADDNARQLRLRAGRASTILSSAASDGTSPTVQTKQLLG